MGDIQKYYENTEKALPHPMFKKIINMNIKPKNAIDLGCGTGRDTIYLIKNGWKVVSIDKEDTRKIIASKLNNEEMERFNFKCLSFENIELEKNNLLVANFSIPFCNKDYFATLPSETRTRAKMQVVASDRARRENELFRFRGLTLFDLR